MPNTKSAIRRVRRVKAQTSANRIRRSKYRSIIKMMNSLILSKKKDEAKKLLPKLNSQIMKIVKTGTIKKRTASRSLSRISKKIYSL